MKLLILLSSIAIAVIAIATYLEVIPFSETKKHTKYFIELQSDTKISNVRIQIISIKDHEYICYNNAGITHSASCVCFMERGQ